MAKRERVPPGDGFYLTGELLEPEPYRRLVHVERMHVPAATPDNYVETRFDPDGTGTLVTVRTVATGIEHGMEASYRRLETMV